MRWARDVEYISELRNTYKVLAGKTLKETGSLEERSIDGRILLK
jgi:hypothetical protein